MFLNYLLLESIGMVIALGSHGFMDQVSGELFLLLPITVHRSVCLVMEILQEVAI